jgi:hypothetical protein
VILRDAPTRTTSAGSFHDALSAHIEVDGRSQEILRATGVRDVANHSSQLSMTIGPLNEDVRVVNGTSYLRIPFVSLPGGKSWLSFRAADFGMTEHQASAFGSSDPSVGLDFLGSLDAKPVEVGKETVDGVDTTHYTFTVDFLRTLDEAAGVTKKLGIDSLEKSLPLLEATNDLHHVPSDAWIDKDGRVRKFEYSLSISAGGRTLREVADLTYSDFGQPVTVQVPPQADTVPFKDVPNVFEQLQSLSAGSGQA